MTRSNRTAAACLAAASVLMAQGAWAQTSLPKGEDAKKLLNQASSLLKDSENGGKENLSRRVKEMASDDGRAEKLLEESKRAAKAKPDLVERAKQEARDKNLTETLSNLSPQGKAMLAQSGSARAQKAPGEAQLVPVNKVTEVQLTDAKPMPLRPTPLERTEKDPPSRTVITSKGSAFFDSRQAMGVFTDDVECSHPQFHLNSDTLEVFMLKDDEKAELEAKLAKRPMRLPDAPEEPEPDKSVKQAIAKGRKVIIQKLSETGELQIGISRHATYVGENGDVILRDWPQVQRGRNVVVATDPSTVMTIKQNGALKTQGPNRVDIVQEGDKKAPINQVPKNSAVPPPAANPTSGPAEPIGPPKAKAVN